MAKTDGTFTTPNPDDDFLSAFRKDLERLNAIKEGRYVEWAAENEDNPKIKNLIEENEDKIKEMLEKEVDEEKDGEDQDETDDGGEEDYGEDPEAVVSGLSKDVIEKLIETHGEEIVAQLNEGKENIEIDLPAEEFIKLVEETVDEVIEDEGGEVDDGGEVDEGE